LASSGFTGRAGPGAAAAAAAAARAKSMAHGGGRRAGINAGACAGGRG